MSFNSQKADHYDYETIAFIHRVINAQLHAKVSGLRFFRHPAHHTNEEDVLIFCHVSSCNWTLGLFFSRFLR